ncbi:MAG: hypothetical protein Q4F00_10045 [bacterium]|nr:hypothetical protein [bacterium]
MKKLLTVIFASLLALALVLPAEAVGRTELSEAQRARLDTFFSNFAEAHVESFVVNNELPLETFVNFGIQHNLINRHYDLVNVDVNNCGVKKEAVEAAVYKYFGHRINAVSTKQYKLKNNVFIAPKAGGEAIRFAQVSEWKSAGNGAWYGTVNIYSASSGFTGNVHGNAAEWKKDDPQDVPVIVERYSFTVTRSPADANRYVLREWLKQ